MADRMDESNGGNAGPSSSSASRGSSVARRQWEHANQVETLDAMFTYDEKVQQNMRTAKPWEKDPHYFKEVKISAVALLKMVIHAKRGGNIEVMGMMQGRVDAHTLVVMDTFALPVEGTETRVNAHAQAYEYMSNYAEVCEQIGRKDKVVGWYHSHPGYGCWLSGIDVNTQELHQQFEEPYVAIVVDPLRTAAAGKVEIGAFRTYPKGYKPPDEQPDEYQSIPLNKIEDFGVHCKKYYSLEVSLFKSALDHKVLDALWDTYWMDTLGSSPLLANAAYCNDRISDLSNKLKQVESWQGSRGGRAGTSGSDAYSEQLEKAAKDAKALGGELLGGLLAQQIKAAVFHGQPLDGIPKPHSLL